MAKEFYELLIRGNADGTLSGHFQQIERINGVDVQIYPAETFLTDDMPTEAKTAIDALLPGLIEAASQTDEIADLKSQLEAKDARIAELEAAEAELNELKAKIEAL